MADCNSLSILDWAGFLFMIVFMGTLLYLFIFAAIQITRPWK
jgi:hypothetical protein